MTIHEFGTDNDKVIVLIHPAVVMWDYYEYVIPLLEECYHVIVPALPGYDTEADGDFTSVEQIATELEDWLISKGLSRVTCIYGCSMGGAIVIRMLADNRLQIENAVLDGAITPYQLPWISTRFIAAKDYLMIWMGKKGGIKTLEKAFSTDEYSQEDLKYIEQVLSRMSSKTIWRTFESANNYKMPEKVETDCRKIEYWYADAEEKDRAWDIKYVKKMFPEAVFRKIENVGHGGLAPLQPERLVRGLEELISRETPGDNRSIEPEREPIYQTDISTAKWIAYDIPGNLGWMAYYAGLARSIQRGDNKYAGITFLPAALMAVGIIELISERIDGLDRTLPKKRLYRGFGALTAGGVTGAVAAGAGAKETTDKKTVVGMCTGAALCAAFAGLLLKGYKKK